MLHCQGILHSLHVPKVSRHRQTRLGTHILHKHSRRKRSRRECRVWAAAMGVMQAGAGLG